MKHTLLSMALVFASPAFCESTAAQDRVPVPAPEGPLPPGLDENLFAEWKLRDFEGRWVLWQRLVAGADDAGLAAWHAWLAKRDEYALLERDAMDDTGWGAASSVLQEADAPQWLRLAHWHSHATDSHTWDAAKAALESRPKLTLAWIEANPDLLEEDSVKKLYDALAKGEAGREACAKYFAPHDLTKLYTPLLPAGETLVDFGDRLVASSDERYVHQTLQAIQILAASKRRPVEWERRLFDLAYAKNLQVRLSALQAATRLDPESLPWPEFRALFDNRGEPDAVRGAAWIALTYAPRVIARRCYLEVLSRFDIEDFSEVRWTLFVERLPEVGGWYELQMLHDQNVQLSRDLHSAGSMAPRLFDVAVELMKDRWNVTSENNVDLAVQSELELLSYLRVQREGLHSQLALERRTQGFCDWVSCEKLRGEALLHASKDYVPQAGVFPVGERAAIDGAGRDLEAWKLLVVREAEELLAL